MTSTDIIKFQHILLPAEFSLTTLLAGSSSTYLGSKCVILKPITPCKQKQYSKRMEVPLLGLKIDAVHRALHGCLSTLHD